MCAHTHTDASVLALASSTSSRQAPAADARRSWNDSCCCGRRGISASASKDEGSQSLVKEVEGRETAVIIKSAFCTSNESTRDRRYPDKSCSVANALHDAGWSDLCTLEHSFHP